MLISRDMGVKGCFSQPKIFKIIFSFLGQKIAFKNIIIPWRIFQNLTGPLKALWGTYFVSFFFDHPVNIFFNYIYTIPVWDVMLQFQYSNIIVKLWERFKIWMNMIFWHFSCFHSLLVFVAHIMFSKFNSKSPAFKVWVSKLTALEPKKNKQKSGVN